MVCTGTYELMRSYQVVVSIFLMFMDLIVWPVARNNNPQVRIGAGNLISITYPYEQTTNNNKCPLDFVYFVHCPFLFGCQKPHFKLSATIVPSSATAKRIPGSGIRARGTPFWASSRLVCEPCARAERATVPSASETRSGSRARAQLRKFSRARLVCTTCTAPLSRGPRNSGALLAAHSRNRGACTRTFSEY